MTSYFEARQVAPELHKDNNLPFYLRKRLPDRKDAFILDFGCGFGHTLNSLKKLGYHNASGIDIDEQAIGYCLKQGLDINKVENLKEFANHNYEKYDFIIMSHVLEHFQKSDIIPTLKIINDLLKKDGRLMLMVPNAQSNTGCYWAYEDFTHYTLFTSGSIYFVLKMAGFNEIEFIDIAHTEGLPLFKKLFKNLFLKYYKFKINFWNRITSSFFHKPSPVIFGFEIKVLAGK